jgi:3-phenylpropionate/trans-cinnamate dioxygenase ferredoxin subunit
MSNKKINWYKIAEGISSINFQPNNMCVVDVDSKKVTLGKFNNTLFAFAYKCPHASGIMADGFIDALGNAVCPIHRYKFSLHTGRNTTGDGYYIKTFATKQTEEGVFIGIEETGIFSFL